MSDDRPPVWVGHISLATDRLAESAAFMQKIGMRQVENFENIAIFELRGGTHLVLQRKDSITPGNSSFDLMVEDIEKTHAEFLNKDLKPTEIEQCRIHQWFYLKEPAGNTIKFNSTHVSNLPV